jgi:hypothetical protein
MNVPAGGSWLAVPWMRASAPSLDGPCGPTGPGGEPDIVALIDLQVDGGRQPLDQLRRADRVTGSGLAGTISMLPRGCSGMLMAGLLFMVMAGHLDAGTIHAR